MLTLDSQLRIPQDVSFSIVEQDAILLNTRTQKYYIVDDVGARLWELLRVEPLKTCFQRLLEEYEVEPAALEKDILELISQLVKHELLEIVAA